MSGHSVNHSMYIWMYVSIIYLSMYQWFIYVSINWSIPENSPVRGQGKGAGENLLPVRPVFAAPPKFWCAVSRFHYGQRSCRGDTTTNIGRPVTPPHPPPPPSLVKNVWDKASAHQAAVCRWMQPLWPASWPATRLQRDDSAQIFLNSVCVSVVHKEGEKSST